MLGVSHETLCRVSCYAARAVSETPSQTSTGRRALVDPSEAAAPDRQEAGANVEDTLAADDLPTPGGDRGSGEPAKHYGRYVVLERIGSGGMGEVFAAWDPDLDRRVALKRLRFRSLRPTHKARLLREAQAMARLRHPNVIAVHDVGRLDDEMFIAMEFVDGKTLRKWAESKPSVAEVIAVYVQAARGLGAAHREGMVHRDFKPDNAMLDADGRVQVLDFGLVAASGDAESNPEIGTDLDAAAGSPRSIESDSRKASLTSTGSVLGTPAYMAPEQYGGAATDARTDQFSLCVALYEALHGHRPYQGSTVAELAAHVLGGEMVAPSNRSLPRWLSHAVERGLKTNPDERFASMEALIEALSYDPSRARRLAWMGVAGIVAVGGVVAMQWMERVPETERCLQAARPVDEVWNEARQARLQQAFEPTYAARSWSAAQTVIEARVAAVSAAYVNACRATHVEQTHSFETLDRRRLCLDEQVARIGAMLQVVQERPEQVAEHVLAIADELPDGSQCTAERAVRGSDVVDAGDKHAVAEVRAQIRQSTALRAAGLPREALPVAEQAVERARALGVRLALTHALTAQAHAAIEVGPVASAGATLDEAYRLARELDSDSALFDALTVRIDLATVADQHDEAERLLQLLQAEARRAGRGDLTGYVHARLGQAEAGRGHYEEAVTHYRAALEIYEDEGRADSTAALNVLGNLGSALLWLGTLDEAEAVLEQTRGLVVERFGDRHPHVARVLHNLGVLATKRGDPAKSRQLAEEALKLRTDALGINNPQTAESQERVAAALLSEGKFEDAEQLYRVVVATLVTAHTEQHSTVALALNNLAGALWFQGKYREAGEALERSYRIKQAVFPSDHPDLILTLGNLGRMHVAAGRASESRTAWQGVLSHHTRRGGDSKKAQTAAAYIAYTLALDGDLKAARTMAKPVLDADAASGEAKLLARAAIALATADPELAKAALLDSENKRDNYDWLRAPLTKVVDTSR